MKYGFEIVILMIIILGITIVGIAITDRSFGNEPTGTELCKNICDSNNLNYHSLRNNDRIHMNTVCLCQGINGEISSWVL